MKGMVMKPPFPHDSAFARCGLALAAVLLQACSHLGGDKIVITGACEATQPALQATWNISVGRVNLTCPAGHTVKTTGTTSIFTNVSVSSTGSGFTVSATGLDATVTLEKCRVDYSFVDKDTKARFDCFGTFVPASFPLGAGLTDAHCTTVHVGTATCALPSPLGSVVTFSTP
jgi:hypothetical protein